MIAWKSRLTNGISAAKNIWNLTERQDLSPILVTNLVMGGNYAGDCTPLDTYPLQYFPTKFPGISVAPALPGVAEPRSSGYLPNVHDQPLVPGKWDGTLGFGFIGIAYIGQDQSARKISSVSTWMIISGNGTQKRSQNNLVNCAAHARMLRLRISVCGSPVFRDKVCLIG